jgi:5-methylcytosine-specific restriction endonuclease McrA
MDLVGACLACIGRKGDRTSEEAGMKLLVTPYVPPRHDLAA